MIPPQGVHGLRPGGGGGVPLQRPAHHVHAEVPLQQPEGALHAVGDEQGACGLEVLRHPHDGAAAVQKDHVVVLDQGGGVPGDALLLRNVKSPLDGHLRLLAEKLAVQLHRAAVDFAEFALGRQGVERLPGGF